MPRNRSNKAAASVIVLAALVFSALAAAPSIASVHIRDEGNFGNSIVLPPESNPYGMSYGEWSVRWWQWAYSLPVPGHPLFDETGADCATGQSGPVWFLGGVFNESATAVREACVIPAGKALFFPIINAEWDNFCPPTDPALTEAEMRDIVTTVINSAVNLTAELDGRPITNLQAYRTPGPSFGIELPANSIWSFFGCDVAPGHYEPLVPDGYYLMLRPLTVGEHTLHFTGAFDFDPAPGVEFALDITYRLTVVPDQQQASGTPGPTPAGLDTLAANPPPARSTWGQVKATYR